MNLENDTEINKMKRIRYDLPKNVKEFLYKLSEYLDTDLYFYGSINRPDYIHGKSDIDIAIFSYNLKSTITKLQHVLHVNEKDFDKIKWNLNGFNINGYKIKCNNEAEKIMDIKCEIAIYDSNFKKIVLNDLKNYNYVPWYIQSSIYVLKTLHYTFPIISNKTYLKYKVYLFNKLTYKKDSKFQVIKQK
jgi:hypothetical protein